MTIERFKREAIKSQQLIIERGIELYGSCARFAAALGIKRQLLNKYRYYDIEMRYSRFLHVKRIVSNAAKRKKV